MVSEAILKKSKTCETAQAQPFYLKIFEQHYAALVVGLKEDGVLLAVPKDFDWEEAGNTSPDVFLGQVSIFYRDEQDEGEEIVDEICVVDCSLEVAKF